MDLKPLVQKEYDKIFPKVKIEDKITFGKYKGMTYKEVYEENPDYIRWLMMNNNTLRFDLESFNQMLE